MTGGTRPPGYSARVPLTDNPWNKHAFETQIVAIILAPTLVCISIYLTLKHVCLSLNPALSRVRPHLYPFIFLPLDVSCLLVQAIGGALAASAALSNYAMVQHGNRCIIAGIVLQVVVLLFFGSTSADYFVRVRKWWVFFCFFFLLSLCRCEMEECGECGLIETRGCWMCRLGSNQTRQILTRLPCGAIRSSGCLCTPWRGRTAAS